MRTEAVTIDAFGTLLELDDPVPPLAAALRDRGVERAPAAIEQAFREEVDYYVPRAHEGRDEQSLRRLQRDCARVFLDALGAELDASEFAPAFVAALPFRPVDGAAAACDRLEGRGLALAVVSNWDMSLRSRLSEVGLDRFDIVATSAEAGAPKPDPRVFHLALERLGVEPGRAVHVGDSPEDEDGAREAGMGFAPAPLSAAADTIA